MSKVKSRKVKTIVLLIAILVPTADVIAGRIYFGYLCNTKSGQYIYNPIELDSKYFLELGDIDKSKFGEHPTGYAIAKGGEFNKIKLQALYDLENDSYFLYSKLFHIYKRVRIIKDKKTKGILSKSVSFRYKGGWAENIYNMSPGTTCPDSTPSIHAQLPQNTFVKKD
ncbi:MAG: hypothetical protein U5P41_02030 [Gammaproteobacteria bacterium]|nr:hypothetical protein [Gammaproteobacteria bacterium]